MKRSNDEIANLLYLLKAVLKQNGWTSKRIAQQLNIGEATAKRWLTGQGLTLDRLAEMAKLVDWSLADLVHKAEERELSLPDELTLAQEREISSQPFLGLLLVCLLNGIGPQEIAKDFAVQEKVMKAALKKLATLALIDVLPSGRVRPLLDRFVSFRKLPTRAQFENSMKEQFLEMDFTTPDAVFASDIVKLSEHGFAMLAEMNEQYRRNVRALALADSRKTNLPRSWCAILSAAKTIDERDIAAAL